MRKQGKPRTPREYRQERKGRAQEMRAHAAERRAARSGKK
jgi:hypothetical protein